MAFRLVCYDNGFGSYCIFKRFFPHPMTDLIGKDAPLEESLERFRSGLKKLNLETEESLWLNPLPNIWSVHLSFARCPQIYSNGKGSSKLAALCSAYGELYERLSTHMSFSDCFLGLQASEAPYVHFKDERWTPIPDDALSDEEGNPLKHPLPQEVLNASLRSFYAKDLDLGLEDLVDLQSSSFARGVCSLPFTNARNGEVVYFPVNLLDCLYGSNGMSAGNSDYEALVQALSEIIERYVKSEIIKKGLSLPEIPAEVISRCPRSAETLKQLQGNGFKAIALDASLGGRFPVVCIVLFNQGNGTCCASFGAHPIFEVALDRTLTELMQGRTFSDLDSFETPTFSLEQTSDPVNLVSHFVDSTGLLPMQMLRRDPDFRFVAWDFQGSTHDQYKALRYMIGKLGFDIYLRSYRSLGVPAYRVIVPGMSEVYPVDDLVYDNQNQGIDFQQSLLSLPDSDESPETYKSYFDELCDEAQDDSALVCAALGVLPDKGTAWAFLRFGELKCLLALAAGDLSSALEYARWTLSYNTGIFPLPRVRFYACLQKAIEARQDPRVQPRDYDKALCDLFGEETFAHVEAHLEGRERFFNLRGSDLSLRGFSAHQELIRIYTAVREADLDEKA